MKPDWKDAPYWARWMAKDPDNCWHFFEVKPRFSVRLFRWSVGNRRKYSAGKYVTDTNYRFDIEKRPKEGVKQ